MLFLGIDVGTGGSRAVMIDEAGKVVASHATEHVPFQSKFPGWAEQDPEDWWRASQESIRAVLSAAKCLPADIAAVGLTGQMHGAVLLDADGQVLRPSLIWCDTRSGPECDWLHATLGREHVIELTCNPALPNFTSDENSLGTEPRARNFCPHRSHPVPKRLCPLPPQRRLRHGCAGSLRHAAARRHQPALVHPHGRSLRRSRQVAAAII